MSFKRIYIDGNNAAWKSFFTHNLSVVHKGEKINTGLAYGFLSSLLFIKEEHLDRGGKIVVVWDSGYKSKLEIYPKYKQKRRDNRDEGQYEDYKEQRKLLEKILNQTAVSTAYAKDEEADDVIAAMANSFILNNQGSVLIVSTDKDFLQLINDRILVLSRTANQESLYCVSGFAQQYGMHPREYLIIQMLMGCLSDGVPGIQGVGIKTSHKLLSEFTNVDKLRMLEPAESSDDMPAALVKWLTKKKKDVPETAKLMARNYKLMCLKSEVQDIKIVRGRKCQEELSKLLNDLEFYSLTEKGKYLSLLS